jgi:hypothetical protein
VKPEGDQCKLVPLTHFWSKNVTDPELDRLEIMVTELEHSVEAFERRLDMLRSRLQSLKMRVARYRGMTERN